MRKIVMTKGRSKILDKMKSLDLLWSYGTHGGKEFYFSDNSNVNNQTVMGMIEVGLLEFTETIHGLPS